MSADDLRDLRTIDLFDDLDDEQLAEWVAVAHRRGRVAPGELIAEQGVKPPGVLLLFAGSAQALLVEGDRVEPVGRQHAADVDGRDLGAHRRTARGPHAGRDGLPSSR